MAPSLPIDITDPSVFMRLIKNNDRENKLRIHWAEQHKELLLKAAALSREPTDYTPRAICKMLMTTGLANITEDHVVSTRHRRTKPLKDHQLIKDLSTPPEVATMKPVEKEVMGLLKTSKKEYLKARLNKPPDERYNFIETSSWRHGWEFEQKVRGSAYGRVHALRDSRSVSGPQPDPIHYGSPERRHFCS